MRILVVEGNTAEIIETRRSQGLEIAADSYRNALMFNAPEVAIEVAVPYAPRLDDRESDLAAYDGFALTGSGVSWSSHEPRSRPYLDFLQQVLDCEKPVIGSCWGMQTVAQICGGHSEPNHKGMELGLAMDITLTPQGRRHFIFEGLPDTFDSPCVHRDHVTALPEGFDVLAYNAVSPIQAIASQRENLDYVGFQFHPELSYPFITELARVQYAGLDREANAVALPDTPSAVVADTARRTRVFANWLAHVASKKAADREAAA